MIDPRLGRAMYRQLADLLRADISRGVYGPGAVIPSEAHLVECHRVSRNTVRLAMEVLRDEGLVVTRHGCGTFVRESSSDATHEPAKCDPEKP